MLKFCIPWSQIFNKNGRDFKFQLSAERKTVKNEPLVLTINTHKAQKIIYLSITFLQLHLHTHPDKKKEKKTSVQSHLQQTFVKQTAKHQSPETTDKKKQQQKSGNQHKIKKTSQDFHKIPHYSTSSFNPP